MLNNNAKNTSIVKLFKTLEFEMSHCTYAPIIITKVGVSNSCVYVFFSITGGYTCRISCYIFYIVSKK